LRGGGQTRKKNQRQGQGTGGKNETSRRTIQDLVRGRKRRLKQGEQKNGPGSLPQAPVKNELTREQTKGTQGESKRGETPGRQTNNKIGRQQTRVRKRKTKDWGSSGVWKTVSWCPYEKGKIGRIGPGKRATKW